MEPLNNTRAGLEDVGAREEALWARPRIDQNFPIKFKNGCEISGFSGYCNDCNQPVPNEDFRGDIFPQSESMVYLSGIFGCRNCKTLTCVNFRVYDDARMLINQGGRWVTYHSIPTFPTKVWRLAKRLFSFLFWKI